MPRCSHFYEKYMDRNKITRNFAKVLQTSHHIYLKEALSLTGRY